MDTPLTPPEMRMADYLLGQMPVEERKDFEQWLLEHPQAQQEFEQLRTMLSDLVDAFPEEIQPSPHLRRNLLQAAEPLPTPAFSRPTSRWPWAVASACAGLVLFLGIQQYSLQSQLTQLRAQLEQSRAQTALLQQADLRQVRFTSQGKQSAASGFVLISQSSSEALFRLEHLPPAPTGKVYRLWAVVHGKRMPCGQFAPSSTGSVWSLLPSDEVMERSPLDITLEPESASHATGETILTSRT